jgi:molybdate transport system substrate-binding protein
MAGCSGAGTPRPRLVVAAASSLTGPLTSCSNRFRLARVRLSFAGSDQLAAQIRRGLEPDVFAAASTSLPAALSRDGLLERPVVFATNELVLAVPSGGRTVRSLGDLAKPGAAVVIGSASVPIGSYTRKLLARLSPSEHNAITRNVRSEEPDVKGIVGKLAQGAATAGFVYRSDVQASAGSLHGIRLSKSLKPNVTYGAGVVRGTAQPAAARSYVEGLRSGVCQNALRKSGFGPPPRS